MPSYGASFEQLSMYFHEINPGPSATSAQANWMAGASEAQQLADELMKNVAELQTFWSGPAATEFYKAMNAIAEFARGLATDMTNMASGLSSMSTMAAAVKPQALAIIAAAQSNPYSRAAAIAPLNGLLNQLGGSYQTDRSTYWKEPTQPPEKLPKAGNESEANPRPIDDPGSVRAAQALDPLRQLREVLGMAEVAYNAFNPDDFPSGVTGEVPSGHEIPPGQYPGWDGTGPLPSPDHPDYQPLPEPDVDLTDPTTEPETSLASATPSAMAAGAPAVSLAAGGSPGMGGSMGAMPMAGGMAMGMGAGGGASGARSAPSSKGGPSTAGGGMMAPGMMGGARRGEDEEESGHRTWLTEDEMAWDGEAAPSGVVGGPPR